METYTYRAFLSYSHATHGLLAPALQAALHRFSKPWFRIRAIHVFRDQTNLSVHPNLWSLIQEALARSEYFILLATPSAAASRWVEKEVAYWLEHRDLSKLIIAYADGELLWDETTQSVDWTRTNCLPELLRDKLKTEPLYVDLRFAKEAGQLSTRNPDFLDAVATIAATLHGLPKAEISGRDVQEHRRTQRIAWGAGIALGILTVMAVWFGVAVRLRGNVITEKNMHLDALAKQEAAARADSQVTSSLSDFQLAYLLRDKEEYGQALGYLARSLRTNPANTSASALATAILQRHWSSIVPEAIFNDVLDMAISPDERQVATIQGQQVSVNDLQTRAKKVFSVEEPSPLLRIFWLRDSKTLVLCTKDSLLGLDATRGSVIYRIKPGQETAAPCLCGDGNQLLMGVDNSIQLVDGMSGKVLSSLDAATATKAIALSGDSRFAAVTTLQATRLMTIQGDTLHAGHVLPIEYDTATLNYDGSLLCVSSSSNAWVVSTADVATLTQKPLEQDWFIKGACFSMIEKSVFTAGGDGCVRQWNIADAKQIRSRSFGNKVVKIWPAPDGMRLIADSHEAMLVKSANSTLVLFDGGDMKQLGSQITMPGKVSEIAFSSSGRYICATTVDDLGGKTFWLWNTPRESPNHMEVKPAPLASLQAGDFPKLLPGQSQSVVSPDRKRQVVIADNVATLKNADGGQIVGQLFHYDALSHAVFTQDSTLLITAASSFSSATQNEVRIWDSQTGKLIEAPISFNLSNGFAGTAFREVRSMRPSSDAQTIFAKLGDDTVHAVALPQVDRLAPSWWPALLEKLGGFRSNKMANLDWLPMTERAAILDLQPAADGSRADLLFRWLAQPSAKRPLLPGYDQLPDQSAADFVQYELRHFDFSISPFLLLTKAPELPITRLGILKAANIYRAPASFLEDQWKLSKSLPDPDILTLEATILHALKQPRLARLAYQAATALPGCPKQGFEDLAYILLTEKDFVGASRIAGSGLQTYPFSIGLLKVCGIASSAASDPAWESYFERAVEQEKKEKDKDPNIYFLWATAWIQHGEYAKADALLDGLAEAAQGDSKYLAAKAICAAQLKGPKAAQQIVRELVVTNIKWAEWKNLENVFDYPLSSEILEKAWLGWLTSEIEEKTKEAAAGYRVSNAQLTADLHAYLADYWTNKQQWEKAIEIRNSQISWFDRAVESMRQSDKVTQRTVMAANWRELGLAHLGAGNFAEAQRAAQVGLAYEPSMALRLVKALAMLALGHGQDEVVSTFTADKTQLFERETLEELKDAHRGLVERLSGADRCWASLEALTQCVEKIEQVRSEFLLSIWRDAEKKMNDASQKKDAPKGQLPGVRVNEVLPDGQAAAIGLQAGDIIMLYADKSIQEADQLIKLTAEKQPEPVSLQVLRAGRILRFEAKAGRLGISISNTK